MLSQAGSTGKIKIFTGQITNGQTIPVPSGYELKECVFIVSPNFEECYFSPGGSNGFSAWSSSQCSVSDTGKVTALTYSHPQGVMSAYANYWIIAIKGYDKYAS